MYTTLTELVTFKISSKLSMQVKKIDRFILQQNDNANKSGQY